MVPAQKDAALFVHHVLLCCAVLKVTSIRRHSTRWNIVPCYSRHAMPWNALQQASHLRPPLETERRRQIPIRCTTHVITSAVPSTGNQTYVECRTRTQGLLCLSFRL